MAKTPTRIFPQTVNLGVPGVLLSTAMTNTKAFDGTETAGTAFALLLTADATNGCKLDAINFRLSSTAGATASGTTNATVVRIWANNGSANTTAANNMLIGEVAIPATTVTALATAVLTVYQITDFPSIPSGLPAGWKIYAGITVAVGGTNCAIAASVWAGDF